MTITRFVASSSILATTLLATSVREKEETFEGVQQSIQERTGKTVRWEEDQAAREQALQDVRILLRKPAMAIGNFELFTTKAEEARTEREGFRKTPVFTGTVCSCHRAWMAWQGLVRKISSPARPINTSFS
jgi:hypothetical protein